MNHKKFILLFIILLVILNIVFLSRNISIFKAEVEAQALIEQAPVYDDFTHKITNIDDIINNKIKGLMYIGRDTCYSCLSFNELLKESCSENTLIYKFDTDYWRNDAMYQQVLDKFEVNTVPVLIRIKDESFETFNFADKEIDDINAVKENLNAFILQDS